VIFHHQFRQRRKPRKGPRRPRAPTLTVNQILAWADSFRERTGRWPGRDTGKIADSIGENWSKVNQALRDGCRGLPGGSSLARLLEEYRGVRNCQNLPPLTEKQILAWADAHHRRTGHWPKRLDGPVVDAPGETWLHVDTSLSAGTRRLPGGTTLARLLARRRGVRHRQEPPPLSHEQILAWADRHQRRTGSWPTRLSGLVAGAPGEEWKAIDGSLQNGTRGLPPGWTLPRLLAVYRGVRNKGALPRLREAEILAWADAHRRRTGHWPNMHSGPILEAPGETWMRVNSALQNGTRGLQPGGSSLVRLLARRLGVRSRALLPRLTRAQILHWADAHHRRTGDWPNRNSGPIPEAPGERWSAVDVALSEGLRGLRGGSSVARLLARYRGVRNPKGLPPLTHAQILAWADAHHKRTGRWPTTHTGPVHGARGETWVCIDGALRRGTRGLPPSSSLALLLQARGRKHGRR
jgi:hypothetical protein